MRYFKFIGIVIAALSMSGCQSYGQKAEAFWTGEQVSGFMEKNAVPINRKLLNKLVLSMYEEGYAPDDLVENIDDEEYFDALKIELRQEYNREYRVASSVCDGTYQSVVEREQVKTLLFGPVMGLMPHSKAGRAFDGCMLQQGWEAGTQKMYDQIFDVAWKKVKRRKR